VIVGRLFRRNRGASALQDFTTKHTKNTKKHQEVALKAANADGP